MCPLPILLKNQQGPIPGGLVLTYGSERVYLDALYLRIYPKVKQVECRYTHKHNVSQLFMVLGALILEFEISVANFGEYLKWQSLFKKILCLAFFSSTSLLSYCFLKLIAIHVLHISEYTLCTQVLIICSLLALVHALGESFMNRQNRTHL